MAKVTLNPLLEQVRGKIGDMVFRQVNGRLVISRAPDFSRRKLSAQQKKQCQRFKDAVRAAKLALTDPKRRAAYQAKAVATGGSLVGVAIGDCLRAASE